ncbi:hypothetical protein EIP86_007518 [Pleurotus ostreatoroseus]|nr:hypothetical protein EIP86_007518 [Pleurotus ostreatoroseus]
MSDARPATSKARGVCKYYQTPRGCFAGANCRFLHGEGERLTPYDKNKTCRYFAAGFCHRGEKCWFRHVQPAPEGTQLSVEAPVAQVAQNVEEDDELMCAICYETPVTFGLLGWRDHKDKDSDLIYSGNTKKCPTCRTPSKFVTPSSIFYPNGHPGKELAIANYKDAMSRIPCKHFQESSPVDRFCPFGKDCFYQHLDLDGTPYVFEHGVERRRTHERRLLNSILQERSRPVLAHINATIDSIRASMEGNTQALAEHQEWQGPSLSAEFLAGLTEERTWTLIQELGHQAFADQVNSIWGDVLPRLEAVVEEFGVFLGDDTTRGDANATADVGADVEDDESDIGSESNADPDEVDGASDSTSVVFDLEGADGSEEPPAADVSEEEAPPRQEEVEPPFLTDGRGRVVWSNTKQSTSNAPA